MYQHVLAAREEARKSPLSTKYGAVLIFQGNIISKGHNFDDKPGLSSNPYCFLCG